MGIFDRMFGRGASAAAQQQPDAQQKFEQLKNKYHTALAVMDQEGVRLQNLHLQDDKLFIRGVAPSEEAKNKVWDQIKLIDPNYQDLTCEITVEEQAAPQAQVQTYTVQPGDTLSKISKQFYGDPDEYMRIFYANRDKLKDPDKIQVGQELVIPPAES